MTNNSNYESLIDNSFAIIAPLINRFFIDHMQRLIKELGMDLEMCMLWGLVSHISLANLSTLGSVDQIQNAASGDIDPAAFQSVKLAGLSRISGLPRETVRRKLGKLELMGKISKSTDGGWVINPDGVNDMTRIFTKQSIKNFLSMSAVIHDVLQQSET